MAIQARTEEEQMETYPKQLAAIIDLEERRAQLQREKVYRLDELQIKNVEKMNDLYERQKDIRAGEHEDVFANLGNMAGQVGGTLGEGMGQFAGSFKGFADILANQDESTRIIEEKRELYRQLTEQYAGYLGGEYLLQQHYNDLKSAEDHYATNQKLGTISNSFGMAAGMAQAFYSLSGEQSEGAFEAFKILKIAETIVATYAAAMKAYDALAGVEGAGPALGMAAAAATIAYGLAQVATIASMSPTSTSAGASSGSGGRSYSAASVAPPDTSYQSETPKPTEINIYVHGNVVDQDKFARELAPSIRKAWEDAA
jgi:hypothetical protein